MRFESIAFDGFAGLEGRRDFGPGLNLIVGPNESGKSRLVVALLYGLCGRVKKRGRGDPIERLRSWTEHSAGVRVSLTLRLANGHLLEATQNLDEPSRSRLTDIDLGRDLTPDVMIDRAPDVSRLLGLDRDVVARTLLVRQGELLGVREGADAMQVMLQRAATRGAADETANAALSRLETFRSERLGNDHASSKRPLRAARDAETSTRRTLEELRALHTNLAELRATLVCQRAELLGLEQERKAAKANELRGELERLERSLSRLDQLDAQLAKVDFAAEPAFDRQALSALEHQLGALRGARPLVTPTTPSPDTIVAELAALPIALEGDRSPRPELVKLHEDCQIARAALERHHANVCVEVTPPSGLPPHVLRELAHQLEQSPPHVPAVDHIPTKPKVAAWTSLLLGLVVVGLGAGLQHIPTSLIGLVLALLGATLTMLVRRRARRHDAALATRRAAEADLDLFRRRRAEVVARLTEHGVPANVANALDAATRHEAVLDAVRLRRTWDEQLIHLENRDKSLQAQLTDALTLVSAPSWGAYLEQCELRRKNDAEARRRADLERLLVTSRHEHDTYAAARQAHDELVEDVSRGAARLGLPDLFTDISIPDACDRLADRLRELRDHESLRLRWRDLAAERATLLGQEDRESFMRRVETLRARVDVAPSRTSNTRSSLELDAMIFDLQRDVAHRQAALDERLRGLPSVPEAEEAYELAVREHARVRRLERLVALVVEHLRDARDTIHRDIAPRLSDALSQVVPRLTQGRWQRARIAVDDLAVTVLREHDWRPAHELSCGTAEQIYLALRVILAAELASPHESPPLIFDDVLAHTDLARCDAICTWIEDLSTRHQVILTTSDDRLIAWAQRADATIHRLT